LKPRSCSFGKTHIDYQFAASALREISCLPPDWSNQRRDLGRQANRIAPLFEDLQFSVVNLECPVGVDGIAPKVKHLSATASRAKLNPLTISTR
jgi:hypothetical protein